MKDSAYSFKCKELFVEKANAYRLHLDKLRWLLAGAYLSAWGVVGQWNESDALTPYVMLMVLGVAVFFILCVQSWHYNMYSLYVKECEEWLVNENADVKPYNAYKAQNIGNGHIQHDAFSFVIIAVLVAIGCSLSKVIAIELAEYFTCSWHAPLIMVLSITSSLIAGLYATRHWQSFAYGKIVTVVNRAVGGASR